MIQLNLFTDKRCSHCGQPMAPSEKNPRIVNGFYDQDTEQLCHWHCKELHYKSKEAAGLRGLYSEAPMMI